MENKRCTKCKELKPLSHFSNDKNRKDGLTLSCKDCNNKTASLFYKTKQGLISKIYSRQIKSSKYRGDLMPSYTKDELFNWANSQFVFELLFINWTKSGFDKWFTPSCDRINDYKPYSLDNLQLTTWLENFERYHNDSINGINKKALKAVIMSGKENNDIAKYFSIHNAERETGINISSISLVCNGKRKTAGGFKWRFDL